MNIVEKTSFQNLRGELAFHHPLARYTSWRVGGVAQCFYRPADIEDLQTFLSQLPPEEPLTWLGLGSNVLIRDGGLPGTVILTLHRLNRLELIEPCTIYAEAGVTCAKVSKLCIKNGFEKGAFFAGIPGTVGGALAMNAGAFSGECWTYVTEVTTMDRQGKCYRRQPSSFTISYRSVEGLNEEFFVAGSFRFEKGDPERAKQLVKQLLQSRHQAQPIGVYSCGSVFKNPSNDYAGRLIEAAGLKGLTVGDAIVSEKHANFIINRGRATAADVENLIEKVKVKVREQFGVELIPECRILGQRSLM